MIFKTQLFKWDRVKKYIYIVRLKEKAYTTCYVWKVRNGKQWKHVVGLYRFSYILQYCTIIWLCYKN